MWNWIKRKLGFSTEEQPEESPIFVEADDPFMAMMVNEVWRTGKPHIGHIDADGNFVMEVIEEKKDAKI